MSTETGQDNRRETLIKLASAAVFLTIVAVAVLIVVSQSGSSGGDSENVVSVPEVERELQGIPQDGMVLGKPGAEVRLLEFADLQCPVCKGYSEEILPQIIENQVRTGEAKLDYRSFTIIDSNSIPAAEAAIAAGRQGRGWNYVEIFYRNQGEEGTDYVNDEFLTAIARAAKVSNIARWNSDRKSAAVKAEVEEATAEAERLGFEGTPSFAVKGPGTQGLEALGLLQSAGAIEEAISVAR
jgi:protein-disulfide isomerase